MRQIFSCFQSASRDYHGQSISMLKLVLGLGHIFAHVLFFKMKRFHPLGGGGAFFSFSWLFIATSPVLQLLLTCHFLSPAAWSNQESHGAMISQRYLTSQLWIHSTVTQGEVSSMAPSVSEGRLPEWAHHPHREELPLLVQTSYWCCKLKEVEQRCLQFRIGHGKFKWRPPAATFESMFVCRLTPRIAFTTSVVRISSRNLNEKVT